jgi:hypothetical protein
MMPRALRCDFFAGFVQVKTLVLDNNDRFDGKVLTDPIASLPQLRALEIGRPLCPDYNELQITGETIMCNRDIELHLIRPSYCLLRCIVTSSLSHHIHHLSLEVSYLVSGTNPGMASSLQQLLEKIGPQLTYLSLTLDNWTASHKGEFIFYESRFLFDS